MKFTETKLEGSYLIELSPFSDDRGWFSRFFCKEEFLKIGHAKEWVQMNHSFTAKQGAIRGMHFQYPPHSEIKMVRCIRGAVLDVIVDLRAGSCTFLNWTAVELSSDNRKMIYIPQGFAHGFQTLADNTELIYLHTEFYKPEAEGGFRFDEKRIGIAWPLEPTEVSKRDLSHPPMDDNFTGLKIT